MKVIPLIWRLVSVTAPILGVGLLCACASDGSSALMTRVDMRYFYRPGMLTVGERMAAMQAQFEEKSQRPYPILIDVRLASARFDFGDLVPRPCGTFSNTAWASVSMREFLAYVAETFGAECKIGHTQALIWMPTGDGPEEAEASRMRQSDAVVRP